MSYQYGYPLVPVRTDQRTPNGAVVAIAWICAVLTLLYMLPWAIAATRGKSNQAMIGVVNLLVGWSLIGWIVSLVMACMAHQMVGAPVAVLVAPAPTQQPTYGHGPVQDATPPPAQLPAVSSATPVPPGWYPAPGNQGHEYWDGTRWTGHRAP